MKTTYRLTVICLLADVLALSGCGSAPRNQSYQIDPPQARLNVNAPLESRALTALQECVSDALRRSIATHPYRNVPVLVYDFKDDTRSPIIQAQMNTVATSTLASLGLRPVDTRLLPVDTPAAMPGALKGLGANEYIIVNGSITGFDPLIRADREARNIGVGGGGGGGLWSAQAGQRFERNIGAVSAATNVSVTKASVFVPQVYSTGRATADYLMISDGYSISGSVAIGVGGGLSRETSRLVGAQQSAEFATRASILAAIAGFFNLSNAGRACAVS